MTRQKSKLRTLRKHDYQLNLNPLNTVVHNAHVQTRRKFLSQITSVGGCVQIILPCLTAETIPNDPHSLEQASCEYAINMDNYTLKCTRLHNHNGKHSLV